MAGLQLHNVEQLYNQLRANPQDVVTDGIRAAAIWKLFRGYPIDPGAVERLEYRAFLQAAMMSAIDGSSAMGWIQTLWESAMKPDATATDLIKDLVKFGLKKYYHHAVGHKPDLYNAVIKAIAYQCGFYFDAIANGIDL